MPENSTTPSSQPRISVVMPLYNAARFVGEALKSIQAQTLFAQEIIVVDDGSTDGSAEIAESFSFVTLIRKEHGGICETLNRGLEIASGDYLSFLDADDRWLPGKTAAQISALLADPDLDMVFGHSRRFRTVEMEGKPSEVVIDVLPGLSKICMLIKRASFERAGRFAERGKHDFLGWYARAKEINLRATMLAEVVAERRIHDANYGILNKTKQRQAYFGALKEHLDRRRRATQASMKSYS